MSDQPSLTADNWYTTGPDLKCLTTLREQTGRYQPGLIYRLRAHLEAA